MARRDCETQMFRVPNEREEQTRIILQEIYNALSERGYNPINQIVGYIICFGKFSYDLTMLR